MTGNDSTKLTLLKKRGISITWRSLCELALRALVGALLSCGRILGWFSPFGAAYAISAPMDLVGAVGTVGVIAGYLLAGSFPWALKYISVTLLSRLLIAVFRGTDVGEKPLFPALTGFCCMAAVGFVYAAEAGWAPIPTVTFVSETFILAGLTYFFGQALGTVGSETDKTGFRVSLGVLILAVFLGLCRWELFGVLSLGRVAACCAVMVCAYRGGTGAGCAFGAGVGAMMDLSAGTPPLFTGTYAIAAMISGLFASNGRLFLTLAFISVNTILVAWTWESFHAIKGLYDVFAASVIFMLLPGKYMAAVSTLMPAQPSGYGFFRAREYTRRKVVLAGEAFKELGNATAQLGAGNTLDPAAVYDRAAEAVCRNCPGSVRCWQQEYGDTVDMLNNLAPRLSQGGDITGEELPQRFSLRCSRFEGFLKALNEERRAYILRRNFRERIGESVAAAVNSYGDTSRLLASLSRELGTEVTVESGLERRLTRYLRSLNMSATGAVFRMRGGRLRVEITSRDLRILKSDPGWLEELSGVVGVRLCTAQDDGDSRLTLFEAEPLAAQVGTAAGTKSGSRESGDGFSCFRTEEGILFVILSDGMGTGEAAAAVTDRVIKALELFLKAGTAPDVALGLLWDVSYLENQGDTRTAAIDLLCVSLFTGETWLYKCGAAPTYIKRGDTLKRVAEKSCPLGLGRPGRDKPFSTKLRLREGSVIVLTSDGVAAGGDDSWIRRLIMGGGDDPVELAKMILEHKGDKRPADDRTVIALSIKTRE